jgi:electron transfer flavoprotein alpha subunit
VDTWKEEIGPLKIIVCIKQVPLLSALRFDPQTRRLVREGVPLEVNELDVYALSEAVRLRTLHRGEVIAITMGPPQAHEALATALAIGADRAIHLSDRAFGGADTAATARTLALVIAREHPELIFCGRHSIDAETSQVGPEIAEMLAIPQISAIQKIDLRVRDGKPEVIATRETDEGTETLSVPIPALVTAAERLNEGIWPDEQAIRDASQYIEKYQVVTAADLNVDSNLLGQKGSPTWVTDVEPDTHARAGHILTDDDPLRLVELLVNDLEAHGLLDLEQTEQHRTHRHSAAPQRLADPLPGKAVWVIAELSPKGIRGVTLELLGKGIELAAKLQGELAAVLIGEADISHHAATLAAYGAERVYVAADPVLKHYTTEGYAAVLTDAILTYRPAAVLLGSTANGRDLAPRVAARLKLGLSGDCIDLTIDDQQRLVQYKPAFGNQIISSILSNTLPAMATLRPGMLHAAEANFSRIPVIEQLPTNSIAGQIHTQIINHEYRDVGVEELESAHIILGVGIGMGEPEQYTQVHRLAALLNAAIGATRNVTDKGWLPKQTQIGLTGRAVAPHLYLTLGIRGAAEHIAGIRKAGYVVSINKNRRAPIFRHSDVGIIGDVHILLPILIEQLQRRKNKYLN